MNAHAIVEGMDADRRAALIGDDLVYPISRALYDRIVLSGALDAVPVELLYGRLVAMSPEGPAHRDVIDELGDRLTTALFGRARVRIAGPLAASNASEPEPDIAVVALRRYRTEHPRRAFLVIESSSSSLVKDRDVKSLLYAEAKIPEYWLVDLVHKCVLVHRAPRKGRYTKVTTHRRSETLSTVAFPDVSVPLGAILPR